MPSNITRGFTKQRLNQVVDRLEHLEKAVEKAKRGEPLVASGSINPRVRKALAADEDHARMMYSLLRAAQTRDQAQREYADKDPDQTTVTRRDYARVKEDKDQNAQLQQLIADGQVELGVNKTTTLNDVLENLGAFMPYSEVVDERTGKVKTRHPLYGPVSDAGQAWVDLVRRTRDHLGADGHTMRLSDKRASSAWQELAQSLVSLLKDAPEGLATAIAHWNYWESANNESGTLPMLVAAYKRLAIERKRLVLNPRSKAAREFFAQHSFAPELGLPLLRAGLWRAKHADEAAQINRIVQRLAPQTLNAVLDGAWQPGTGATLLEAFQALPDDDQIDIARGVARDLQSTITEQREAQETAEDSDGKMGSAPTEPIVRNEYGEITNPSSTRHADDYERDASEAARLYAEHQQSTRPRPMPRVSPAPANEGAPRPSRELTEAEAAQRDLYRAEVKAAKLQFLEGTVRPEDAPEMTRQEYDAAQQAMQETASLNPARVVTLPSLAVLNSEMYRVLRHRIFMLLRDTGMIDPKNPPLLVLGWFLEGDTARGFANIGRNMLVLNLGRTAEQIAKIKAQALAEYRANPRNSGSDALADVAVPSGGAAQDERTMMVAVHEAAHFQHFAAVGDRSWGLLTRLANEVEAAAEKIPDLAQHLRYPLAGRARFTRDKLTQELLAQAAVYFVFGHASAVSWMPLFSNWQRDLTYGYPNEDTAVRDLAENTANTGADSGADRPDQPAGVGGRNGGVRASDDGLVHEPRAPRLTPALPKVDAWLADPATQGTRLARLSEAELRELAADVSASAPTGKGAALLAKIRDYQQAHEAARKLAATSATTWARQLAQLSAPALRQLQRVLANPSSAEELGAALQAELADLDAQTQHVRGITAASQAKVVALEGRLDALQEQRRQHKREELTRREAERNALVASGKRRGAPTDAEQSRLDDLTAEIAALNTERRGFKQAEVAELTAQVKRAKTAAARAADHRNVLLKLLESNRRATKKNFAAARQETEARRANQRRFVAEEIDIRTSIGAFDTAASARQQAPNTEPAFTDAQVAALKSMFEGGWPRLGASLAGRSPKALESLVRGMNRVVAATDEQLAAVLPEGWSLAKLRALAKGWGRSIELAVAKRNDPNAAKPAPDAAAAADAAWREEFKTERAEVTADTRPLNVWHGSGENAKLSNLSLRPFSLGGRKFFSVEHAYQTLKSGSFDESTYRAYTGRDGQKIRGAKSAKTEKGKDAQGKPTGASYNVKLMYHLVLISFQQNPEAAAALLETGERPITHIQDRGVWRNVFPRILTAVRTKLREEQETQDSAEAAKINAENAENVQKEAAKPAAAKNKPASAPTTERIRAVAEKLLNMDARVWSAHLEKASSEGLAALIDVLGDASVAFRVAGLPADRAAQKRQNLARRAREVLAKRPAVKPAVAEPTGSTAPVAESRARVQAPQDALSGHVLHSGGAAGSDTMWGRIGAEYGLTDARHYYHGRKTPNGNVAISEQDYRDGVEAVKEPLNKSLA